MLSNSAEFMVKQYPVAIIGGGPAGLTAAYELTKNGQQTLVLEKGDKVGGIARTEMYKGYRFDIGGHRFFTKVGEVNELWQEVLGDEFIEVPRLSRIYYQGKFFDYPLSLLNTLSNLGVFTSFMILMSYLNAKAKAAIRRPEVETFEDWVTHCFGRRLYLTFFKTYTEKVWGIPCDKIQAEWAIQRIRGVSLKRAVLSALFSNKSKKTASLIKSFQYPVLGPGMMWERFEQLINEKGSEVWREASVTGINREGNRITGITVEKGGIAEEVVAEQYISSMPITALVRRLDPPPPDEVLEAARSLSYRAFLIVALIVNIDDLFPDNWIYIHAPEAKVGRIQNFKNWSPAMVPEKGKTCLGMEYFCSEGDEVWSMKDEDLIALATQEIVNLGFGTVRDVEDGTVIRQPKAYPVYDRNYRQHLEVIREFLEPFENLQTVGRNGMHRYNNQDHSMLTGLLAARNLLNEEHDLWNVNTDRSYYEEFTTEELKQREQESEFSMSSSSL